MVSEIVTTKQRVSNDSAEAVAVQKAPTAIQARLDSRYAPERAGKRADEICIAHRTRNVLELMEEGASTSEIRQQGVEIWKMTSRQIDNYIKKAKALLSVNLGTEGSAEMRDRLAAKADLISSQAARTGQFAAALSALSFQAKLYGVAEPEKVEVSGAIDYTASLVTYSAERIDQAKAIREKAAAAIEPETIEAEAEDVTDVDQVEVEPYPFDAKPETVTEEAIEPVASHD